MEQLAHVIRQMIQISESEMAGLLGFCRPASFHNKAILSKPDQVPQEIFFINKGLLRVIVTDVEGTDHSMHFALENQFIADYSAFILNQPSLQTLQALEPLEVIVMPRAAIDWGYANLQQGDKLGRLIAEYYFIYQDHRIRNLYARTPMERYEALGQVFPNIQNRVPQHMIASYLGITPVHLSRLKKADRQKI